MLEKFSCENFSNIYFKMIWSGVFTVTRFTFDPCKILTLTRF